MMTPVVAHRQMQRWRLATIFEAYLGCPAPLVKRLWQALCCHQEDGYPQALLYALTRPGRTEAALWQSVQAVFDGPLAPARIIPYIDGLVLAGDLTQAEGSELQEAILAKCGKNGHWREP